MFGNGPKLLTITAVSSRFTSQCPVHPDLMKVLICPLSKTPLRYKHSIVIRLVASYSLHEQLMLYRI